MNEIQQTTLVIPTGGTWHKKCQDENSSPHSRLYCLIPYEIENIWCESLTGYINRLGQAHHVAPRSLVAQEVIPWLSTEQQQQAHMSVHFSTFGYQGAMSLNGRGTLAQKWVTILEHLTGRTDLSLLTLPWWIGDLSSRKLIRNVPVWCPSCLEEWQANGVPLYQPLMWILQVITICPRHREYLQDRCPYCDKPQAVIAANRFRPGTCTHCSQWLGTGEQYQHQRANDHELITWQEWVLHALEELFLTSRSTGILTWELFFTHLADCLKEQRAFSMLSRITGINRQLLHRWVNAHDMDVPLLGNILKFCYACDVTPLQIMRNQMDHLKQTIQNEVAVHTPLPRSHYHHVNLEQCQAFLKTILEEHEMPQSLRQIEKHLGHTTRQLSYHFPEECALIASRAREYRQQRKEERLDKVREQVRQAMFSLHEQGIYPSQRQLRTLLLGGLMLQVEAKDTWRTTLRELGFEA